MRLLLALVVLLALPASATAAPWQDADKVVDGLFDAQTELVLANPAQAVKDARRARGAYEGELNETIREADPAADRALSAALREATQAAADGDQTALASARGAVRAGLYRGAFS